MAIVLPDAPANIFGPVVLKDQQWTRVLNSAAPDSDTIATAATGATAPTRHYDLGRGTESAFKVKYTQNTTTALHVVPQFSMDGTNWEDDSNLSDPTAVVDLQMDFTTSTTRANSDGLVFRGLKVPFRFARFLAWWDGTVGTDVVAIYALKGAV